MLHLFKKNSSSGDVYDYSYIRQDIHCHLLPGIDDGSPDADTSLLLIRSLLELGFKKFICTPHVIGDMYRNTPETIHEALQILKSACAKEKIDVELSAAAEYMLDDNLMDMLRRKEKLLTLTGNYILTEIPFATAPDNLEKISFELLTAGYQPLMAHPERYLFYQKNHARFQRIKDLGFLLQTNLLSLTGYYGKPAAKAAMYLFQNNLVDFVGTDLHHINHLNALTDEHNRELFKKVLGDRVFNTFEFPSSADNKQE